MGLYTKLHDDIQEVDVIVAGGGSAGCIVASRIAQANAEASILVIESGPNNDQPTISVPSLFLANLLPSTKTNIFYKGIKETQLADREIVVPSGGVLGGGSSTNLMMYTRAQRSDFDAWKMPGWSADEMLPYLKKLETYHGPGPKELHGSDGPIQISGGPYRATRPENDFVKAAAAVGWPEIKDLQMLDTNNGVQRALRYISPDGKRQDVASKYLKPLLEDGQHHNLHVLLENQVVRVLVENQRAVGVEFQPNPAFQPDNANTTRTVKARKMVVVSCGACGTPSVLERSGIGSPEVLKRAGVPVEVDLTGVGDQYNDHHLLVYPYYSSLNEDETLDAVVGGRVDVGQLIATGAPIMSWNVQDITCKLRPNDADVASLGPAFQKAWDRDFRDKPDRPLVMMATINGFPAEPTGVPPGQYYGISTFSVYPYSRGHLHITGPSPADPLDFATGFFSDPDDLDIKKHMWAYKKQREVVRRMNIYRGEFAAAHPPFAADSAVAVTTTAGPADGPLVGGGGGDDIADLVYSADDDAVLEAWLRKNVSTTWHSLGTCRMAPRDDGGVVDARLGVYGVEGLKVADLSIPPANVAANTNNTALAIGEKAADLFIEELGFGKTASSL